MTPGCSRLEGAIRPEQADLRVEKSAPRNKIARCSRLGQATRARCSRLATGEGRRLRVVVPAELGRFPHRNCLKWKGLRELRVFAGIFLSHSQQQKKILKKYDFDFSDVCESLFVAGAEDRKKYPQYPHVPKVKRSQWFGLREPCRRGSATTRNVPAWLNSWSLFLCALSRARAHAREALAQSRPAWPRGRGVLRVRPFRMREHGAPPENSARRFHQPLFSARPINPSACDRVVFRHAGRPHLSRRYHAGSRRPNFDLTAR